ncbi:MAG: DUF5615 family PIN-like protein [Gaiellales bacterium]
MRLLLDADLSHRRIGAPLERRGHDVVSLQADPQRRSLPDELVLELAAHEKRILVTRNARHFQPLARAWMDEQCAHSGIVLIWTMPSNAFKEIVDGIDRLLVARPNADDWRDLVQSV